MAQTASILVVDDEPRLLEGIQMALEEANYRVLKADNGVVALQVLHSQPVDLILADIAMPRMNGYQLYERVREDPRWVQIPFIFLTARALDSDIRYGKELGVDDYLTKPFDHDDLLSAVRGKLRRAEQLALQTEHPPRSPSSTGATSGPSVFSTRRAPRWSSESPAPNGRRTRSPRAVGRS